MAHKGDTFFYNPEAKGEGREPEFTGAQRGFYEQIKCVCNESDIQLHSNFSVGEVDLSTSFGKDGKGYTIPLSKKAPLHTLVKDNRTIFNSRWFGIVSAVKLSETDIPKGMTEEDMSRVIAELEAEVRGTRERRETHIAYAKSIVAAPRAVDSCKWHACLGSRSHFVSVYKRARAGFAKPEYYIVVHSDAGHLGEALCKFIVDNPTMLLEELIAHPFYHATKSFSERIHRQLVALVCSRLYLHIALKDDTRSFRDESCEEAFPLLYDGRFFARTDYNFLHDTGARELNLFYYCGTARILNSIEHGHLIHMRGARSGISLYPVRRGVDYHNPTARVMNSGRLVKLSHKNRFASVPVGAGRVRCETLTKVVEESGLDADEVCRLYRTFHWSGKKASLGSVSTPEDAVAALNTRLYMHKTSSPADDTRLEFIMNSDSSQTINLVPISVAIPGDDGEQ